MYSKINGNILIPPRTSPRNHPHVVLNEFIADMRHQYSLWTKGLENELTGGRKVLLDALKFGWHIDSTTAAADIDTSDNAGNNYSNGKEGRLKMEPNILMENFMGEQNTSINDNNSWEVYAPPPMEEFEQQQKQPKANSSQVDEHQESDDDDSLVF